MEKEKLREAIEKKILAHKEQEKKLDILNTNFEAYAVKKVESIVEKCNYRIGNLENAHLHASVADNEEIQRNVDDLTSSISTLEGEVEDLSTIKKNVSVLINVPDFDDLSSALVSNIDKIISTSERTIKKAKLIIDNKYDEARDIDDEVRVTNVTAPSVEEKEAIIPPVENKEVENNTFTPTAVKTDSLEELARSLDASMAPVQNNTVDLQKTMVQPFGGTILQNNGMLNNQNYMAATNSTVAPVLNPVQQQPLGVAPQMMQAPVAPVAPTAPVAPVEAIQSAKSVDDGFVKVESVMEFTPNNGPANQEEGPTLKRVA